MSAAEPDMNRTLWAVAPSHPFAADDAKPLILFGCGGSG